MEKIDVLDENGIKTNDVENVEVVHKMGLWHRAIQVVLIDLNNKILIQQRSSSKSFFPNCWDMAITGHVAAGEISTQTAIREIFEEIGLNFNENDLNFIFSFKDSIKAGSKTENLFFDIFCIRKDYDFEKIKIQESEVQDVKLVDIHHIRDLYNNGLLLKNKETYQLIDLLEEKFCGNK